MITKETIIKETKAKKLKSYQVAERIGMAPGNYYSFLLKKDFSQNDLQRIADALGVEYVSEFRPKQNGASATLPGFIPEK